MQFDMIALPEALPTTPPVITIAASVSADTEPLTEQLSTMARPSAFETALLVISPVIPPALTTFSPATLMLTFSSFTPETLAVLRRVEKSPTLLSSA